MSMEKNAKIYVAGHRGLVGASIVRLLEARGYHNLVLRTHTELDLLRQADVERFFEEEKPDYVVLAAARVGGIAANIAAPAQFLYENLVIETNLIHSAYQSGVKKLLFEASSCIYPRLAPQPMKEEYLLDGKVEPTNEGYALAKIAGLKLCEMYNRQYHTNYISVMPCNVYGVGDNFDPQRSHVVAALLRKFHEAKESKAPFVTVWGTGNARRELLFVDDLADASLYALEHYSGDGFLNIGTGSDVSIAELAALVKKVVGYEGDIRFDATKPDGMPQKLMDVSRAAQAGWQYKTELEDGLRLTYEWFLKTQKN